MIFANGYSIMELTASIQDVHPAVLAVIAKIYDEAMPETEIRAEERVEAPLQTKPYITRKQIISPTRPM